MNDPAPIVLMAYSGQWPLRFEAERDLLRPLLPPHFSLEHIGSTSVPGMPAKPIIDMLLGAGSLTEIEQAIPQLERLGYQYVARHERVIPGRRFLAKPVVRPRHFHLHGVVQGGQLWRNYLVFRQRLRAEPALAEAYARLKQQLASAFGDDRAGYTEAKHDFIHAAVHGTIGHG